MANQSEIIFYKGENGNVKIEILYEGESFWMTQKKIAQLFDVQRPAITKHLKNIFDSGELVEDSVSSKMEHTAEDGKIYQTKFYDLDAIIAIGYRVNSKQATKFRIWATKTLNEFITKGFVLDDKRLKQNRSFGKDYFDELLERIREIRASEKRFYQKITDIYATSIDYDKDENITKEFFATSKHGCPYSLNASYSSRTERSAQLIYDRIALENKL